MSRLIVASNRVADLSRASQSGGLAVALGDALQEGKGLWFGWDGEIVEDGASTGLKLTRQGNVSIATQPLTKSEYDNYYLGFSNNVLWPACHYRLDLAKFDQVAFDGYRAVNERFADTLAALIERDDLVWVHDYHLIPLAAALRERGVENRIGFFLHIPMPPPEILAAVPYHEWLFDTLFAYDVIGFQTDQDVQNFGSYAERNAKMSKAWRQRQRGRNVVARCFPIGIDVDAFAEMAHTAEADDRIRRLSRGAIRAHIIGVDRLDYSKGLPDRMRAFHRLLQKHEEHRKQTVLMQIAPPTREELTAYAEIRSELEQLSGSINGEFGDFDWTPVRYIHRSIPRETLAALFRGSHVGMVTPLRDGMNLVAKEYVAAQDEDDPGVLVLSQFAGAAADLQEALIVNPYDLDEMADALHRAITMSLPERQRRHRALLERVRRRDIASWRRNFMDALAGRPGAANAA